MTGQTPTPVLEQRLREVERQLATLHRTHAHIAALIASRRTDGRRTLTGVPTQYQHPETAAPGRAASVLPAPVWPDPLPEWATVAHQHRIALDSLGVRHVKHADVARIVAHVNRRGAA